MSDKELKNNVVIDTLVDIPTSSIDSLTTPTKLNNRFAYNNIKVTGKTLSTYIDYLITSLLKIDFLSKLDNLQLRKRC